MKSSALLATLLLLLIAAPTNVEWPDWAARLRDNLKCGLTIDEVREISTVAVVELEAGAHPFLGRYYASKGRSDLWLRFDDQELLTSVTLAQTRGWRVMKNLQSPQENLCSGEFMFALRILAPGGLSDVEISIDGKPVSAGGKIIPLSSGHHELVLKRGGGELLTHAIQLGPQDLGNPTINLADLIGSEKNYKTR